MVQFLLYIYLVVKLQGHREKYTFHFTRNYGSIFPHVLYCFSTLITMSGGSSCSSPTLDIASCFNFDHSSGNEMYLTILIICISQITNDFKHIYMSLLAKCRSTWVKSMFMSFVHMLIGLFILIIQL